MQMGHTPGKWDRIETFETNQQSLDIVSDYKGYWVVARVSSLNKEDDANLIAAAPEMLSILKRMVTYYISGETRPEALFKIEQALEIIAKAEGKRYENGHVLEGMNRIRRPIVKPE